jgi:hypothetical protein
VLHECAHGLAYYYAGPGEAEHGPIFVRVFLDLLVRFAGLPAETLHKSLRLDNIRVAPPDKCPVPPEQLAKDLIEARERDARLHAQWQAANEERKRLERQFAPYLPTFGG